MVMERRSFIRNALGLGAVVVLPIPEVKEVKRICYKPRLHAKVGCICSQVVPKGFKLVGKGDGLERIPNESMV